MDQPTQTKAQYTVKYWDDYVKYVIFDTEKNNYLFDKNNKLVRFRVKMMADSFAEKCNKLGPKEAWSKLKSK